MSAKLNKLFKKKGPEKAKVDFDNEQAVADEGEFGIVGSSEYHNAKAVKLGKSGVQAESMTPSERLQKEKAEKEAAEKEERTWVKESDKKEEDPEEEEPEPEPAQPAGPQKWQAGGARSAQAAGGMKRGISMEDTEAFPTLGTKAPRKEKETSGSRPAPARKAGGGGRGGGSTYAAAGGGWRG